MRRTIVWIARALAERGIGSIIPDLPGAGDSLRPTALATLSDWRQAAHDAFVQGGCTDVVAFRGGTLLDDALPARSWWRYGTVEGDTLVRGLVRAARLSASDLLAAYNPAMLSDAVPVPPPGPHRTAPLQDNGIAPWNRAEPGDDAGLVAALVEDIIQWVRTCAAR